jgi:general secretion pathway protein K
MMTTRAPTRQRGMAILLAMLILAMAAIVASGFVFRAAMEWRKFDNAASLGQARWVLRAAERWAGAVLRDDARQSSVDHRGELWARELPPVDSEGYALSGRVEDLDGRFNLNNLVKNGAIEPAQLAMLRRLLAALDLPESLAVDIADWLDADAVTYNGDTPEDAYYRTLTPAVAPIDRPLANVDELNRVRGVDAAVLARLRPYVAALPDRTGINVNTASAEVLAALVDGLTLEQAYTLAARRDRTYFRDAADFTQALPPGLTPVADMTRVDSRFFLVTARARHDRVDVGSRALFRRDAQNAPELIWRASL